MLLTFLSCKEKVVDKPNSSCDQLAGLLTPTIDPIQDPFNLDTAILQGDCLEVTCTYGGGCGETRMSLSGIHSDTEQYPPYLSALLHFADKDSCEALKTKTESFDVTPFRKEGYSEITIGLSGNNQSYTFLYKY